MIDFNQMLDAGVHFGHLRRKWNPKMAPYIYMERNGIHIIDLHKTAAKVEEASAALKQIAKSGKKVLFVATKKQAKDIVAERVKRTNMPFVTERWPGGMLTNFVTIRKAIKKMNSLEKLLADKDSTAISKRERLQITREKAKLEKNLGSIADLTRLPSALFIVDINKEHIAVAEAKRLNINIDKDETNQIFSRRIAQSVSRLAASLEIQQAEATLELLNNIKDLELQVDMNDAQSIYFNKS